MMRGSDLWFHLAIGRWIMEHKSLPLVDSWSFTRNGQPWLQHEWLTDLLFQGVASSFGLYSLVYVKWALLVATFLLLFRVVWRLAQEPVSSYLSVLLAAAVAAPFLDLRPHLVTTLGYVVLLCLTLSRKRPPLYLPLIFLVWANLHGGFFFGLMALSVLLAPTIIAGPAADRLRSSLIWLSSALVCLLNPNGIKAFAYPLKYASIALRLSNNSMSGNRHFSRSGLIPLSTLMRLRPLSWPPRSSSFGAGAERKARIGRPWVWSF